jgi:hypothetical protein
MERLVSKFSEFSRRIEDLLENSYDQNRTENEKTRAAFEVSQDASLIRGLSAGLPAEHLDRIVVLFTRLAMFFNAGVMVENDDGKWKAQAVFDRGVVDTLHTEKRPEISLPQTELLKVLKTNPLPLLEKLQLTKLDPQNELTCLLIKVSGDFCFVLLSKMPDLWLKNHLEAILHSLQNGIAD